MINTLGQLAISANRGRDEISRYRRLIDLVEKIKNSDSMFTPFTGEDEKLNSIIHLSDHKGVLSVFWSKSPTQAWMSTVENIWEGLGESRDSVIHYFCDQEGNETQIKENPIHSAFRG